MTIRQTLYSLGALFIFLATAFPTHAIPDNGLGKTPYMGWSSWSLEATKYPGYGNMAWVTAEHIEAQSDALHKTLQAHGYNYVNMDSGWMGGYDANGRPIPDPKKFPLGIVGVADHVHRNGQKLGIYWIPGINEDLYTLNPPILGTNQHIQDIVAQPHQPANGWGGGYKIDYKKPGAQAYINSIADQFAAWGIDFFKLDGVTPGSDHTDLKIDARPDVEAWAVALKQAGRPIWLELSWGLDRRYAGEWQKYAHGRRITTDVETYGPTLTAWSPVSARFEAASNWAKEAGPGKGWNDLDSLLVGSGTMDGLNSAERQTMMTLWAIACSPLYAGDDLTKLDTEGMALLTNDEVIAVDQAGHPASPVYTVGNKQVWRSRNADGSVTAALFNLDGKESAIVTATWRDLGLTGRARVHDLWSHRDLETSNGSFRAILAPHGSLLVKITAATPAVEATVTIDPSIRYQTWQGWGTSLAWWAKVIGGFPEPARSDYIEKAFDPDKGLGLNVVRYNIGGGENPIYQAPNKPLLSFRAAVPGYEPSPGVWDWTADAGQRWVLQAAIQKGADQLEAFSNSPPWWATRSGSVTGAPKGADNLKPEFDGAFADYLTTVVAHFRNTWGITFRDLEPLNEPSGGWTYGGDASNQEGCHVDRPHQNDVVKATGAALARRHIVLTTSTASDEPSIGDADNTFGYYDAAALSSLTKINTHSYGGGDRTQLGNFARSAGKDLWLSEYGDGDESGLQMSRQILADLNGLHPTAWVYWQVVDSANGWGFLKNPLADETATAYTINKKYYVMAQYSKFLRPGFRFLAAADPNSVAAYDPNSCRLVFVTTNSDDTETRLAYDLSSFTQLGSTVTAYRTSFTEDLAKLPPVALKNKQFVTALPPRSVTTYVIEDASYSGPPSLDYTGSFALVNQETGLVLDTAQAANAADIIQSANTPAASRRWRFLGLGNGDYKVVNASSGFALDVSQSSVLPGGVLIQYSDNGGDNQIWHLTRAGGGAYTLVNRRSGLALAAPENAVGTRLTQQTADGSARQLWRLEPTAL